MRITRGQLGQIIREEAQQLREAGIPIKQAREMYGTSGRASRRAASRPQGGMNDKISAYNGEYFRLVDAVRDLADKMGVEPSDLCSEIARTLA